MYIKSSLTIEDQILQLKTRGLHITNDEVAEHFLSHISYFRLAGYWWPMQLESKEAYLSKAGGEIEDVISLYNLDRELRIIVFDAVEKIEISLSTKLIHHLSHEFDPWRFQNLKIFQNIPQAVKTLAVIQEQIEISKDIFIKSHKSKHKDDLRFPPSWKTLALASFGALSKIYGNLKNSVVSKNLTASELGVVNHTFLPSWLQSLAQIRNYCAHHSRLWNKNLSGRPKLLSNPPYSWLRQPFEEKDMHMLYVNLCCIKYMLNVIQPQNNIKSQLIELMKKYPTVDEKALSVKLNWLNEPLSNS